MTKDHPRNLVLQNFSILFLQVHLNEDIPKYSENCRRAKLLSYYTIRCIYTIVQVYLYVTRTHSKYVAPSAQLAVKVALNSAEKVLWVRSQPSSIAFYICMHIERLFLN